MTPAAGPGLEHPDRAARAPTRRRCRPPEESITCSGAREADAVAGSSSRREVAIDDAAGRRRSRRSSTCARTRGSPARRRDEIDTASAGQPAGQRSRARCSCAALRRSGGSRPRSPRRLRRPARRASARPRARSSGSMRSSPSREDALAHLEAQAPRHQRLGELGGRGRRGRSGARAASRGCRGSPRRGEQRGRAPLRSISALVTSVVPCTTSVDPAGGRPARQARSTPSATASAGSPAWSGPCRCRSPGRRRSATRSVKVPPMSMPKRTAPSGVNAGSGSPAGSDRPASCRLPCRRPPAARRRL